MPSEDVRYKEDCSVWKTTFVWKLKNKQTYKQTNSISSTIRPGNSDPFYTVSYYIYMGHYLLDIQYYSLRKQNWPLHKCISHPPWKKIVKKNCALLLRILLRSFCRKPDRAGVIVYTVANNCTQAWFSKFPGRGQFEVTVFTVTQMRAK